MEQQNRSMKGKSQITIEYDEKIIAIETFDEKSVEVITIQNAFKCGEIKGLSCQMSGQKDEKKQK